MYIISAVLAWLRAGEIIYNVPVVEILGVRWRIVKYYNDLNITDNFEKFMVSQVAIIIRDGECLVLEDAANPGTYVIPGGRIDKGEDPREAFKRELKEEINLDKFEIIKLVDADVWYVKKNSNPMCGIAYLIDADIQEVALSDEHSQARWVSEDELSSIKFLWPCAERMCRSGFEQQK